MKLVILIGQNPDAQPKLEYLPAILMNEFWQAYYGRYNSNDLPPEVAKQFEKAKGTLYTLKPFGIDCECLPVYQDNEMVLIVNMHSNPTTITKNVVNLIKLVRTEDFWTKGIDPTNIVCVTRKLVGGQEVRTQDMGLDNETFLKSYKKDLNKTNIDNIDMLFVYSESKIPATMLSITADPNYPTHPCIHELQKQIGQNIIKVCVGIDQKSDALFDGDSIYILLRNLRQSIMLLATSKDIKEFVKRTETINSVEVKTYLAKHPELKK